MKTQRVYGDGPRGISRAYVELPDGRTIDFFVNAGQRRPSGSAALVVVQVVDADERGGVEILRADVPPVGAKKRRAGRA